MDKAVVTSVIVLTTRHVTRSQGTAYAIQGEKENIAMKVIQNEFTFEVVLSYL